MAGFVDLGEQLAKTVGANASVSDRVMAKRSMGLLIVCDGKECAGLVGFEIGFGAGGVGFGGYVD